MSALTRPTPRSRRPKTSEATIKKKRKFDSLGLHSTPASIPAAPSPPVSSPIDSIPLPLLGHPSVPPRQLLSPIAHVEKRSDGDCSSQPEALSERLDREACNCETEMGNGIQRVPGVRRFVHELAVSEHGGVH